MHKVWDGKEGQVDFVDLFTLAGSGGQGIYVIWTHSAIYFRGCRNRMIVGFPTTCAIGAYHH